MTPLELAALFLSLSAIFGYLNHRFIRLPQSVALVAISLVVSLTLLGFDTLRPDFGVGNSIRSVMSSIDFNQFLMKGILSFLLFAGALHVKLDDLLERKWTILSLSTIGVLISTGLTALGFWGVCFLLGIAIPIPVALVFGALISPTDPVAVLSLFKKLFIPSRLQVTITGESLFNDGVAVVVYTILVGIAFSTGLEHSPSPDIISIAGLFITEAFGGALLGLVFGYVAFLLMKTIDEYVLEIMLTLALVTLTYAVALRLHVSGPIAMVIAGLLIGNTGVKFAMSDKTKEHIENFWYLIDEILNSVLFILIGFEAVMINETASMLSIIALMIPVILISRFLAISVPVGILRHWVTYEKGTITILTAAGLRGGISVALALALPQNFPHKELILAVCYGLVLFSILIQGTTVESIIRFFHKKDDDVLVSSEGELPLETKEDNL